MEVNDALLLHYVKLMTTDTFERKFFVAALEERYYLKYVITTEFPAAKSIY